MSFGFIVEVTKGHVDLSLLKKWPCQCVLFSLGELWDALDPGARAGGPFIGPTPSQNAGHCHR